VSPPYFLVDDVPAADEYTLDGPEGHHAAVVQRLRPGERLVLTDGRGGTATAVVQAAGRGTLSLSLISREYVRPPSPRLTVIQALAKGDRSELAVQVLTEVGVDEIVPWTASRSIVQWRGDRRWVATAREAAKQSRRAWFPVVAPVCDTAGLVARLGPGALVLHEDADTPLSTVDLAAVDELAVVVGPEGGITPEELAAFTAAGATPVRLGDTILRTSTAGAAALSVLAVRLHRW
jgi:16S rRNA (uracil1498-N3)-methyltransferase